MITKLILALAMVLPASVAVTASTMGVAVAATPDYNHCRYKEYGYYVDCRRIPKHNHGNLHIPIPGNKLKRAATALKTGDKGLDLVNAYSMCPPNPPAHAACFSVYVYNDVTGKPVQNPPYGITIQSDYPVYAYNPSTGKWTSDPSDFSAHPGTFALIL